MTATLANSALYRICETVHAATGLTLPPGDFGSGGLIRVDPRKLREHLCRCMGEHAARVRVAGTLDARLLFIEQSDGTWQAADLSGRPHGERDWPAWSHGHITLDDPGSWLSPAVLDEQAVYRLSRPKVLLAALYHPEHFPLPRFPLGISDLARAARTTLQGVVELTDMQLGVSMRQLLLRIAAEPYDILGISATFGQHDLMVRLLDSVYRLSTPPLIIAGGSLTARNEQLLLEQFPELLIARAGGESTVKGLLHYWHGDTGREDIPGLGYTGAARGGGLAITRRRTAKPVASAAADEILPELDLLPETFRHHGVAQLETSRGCTNFCSFCPRGHKGIWAGARPDQIPRMLSEIGNVFDHFPHISRTLYLVDEEFIGRGESADRRALQMAATIHEAELAWESSCRVDQVVRSDKDTSWHTERARMWRTLLDLGLRRMLFGVESGVDSVLERFNKETTGEQNALTIRTLSALGVPTRFTYITFDQLMTLSELRATYAFQGRTDLLIAPQPHLSPEEIVRGVRNEDWVTEHTTGRALHTGISYMLVSMECLIGASYTRAVQRAGLAGQPRPSMGRVDADFADWRIGIASEHAQRWVDRNFALDYTLKSLEKVLDGTPRYRVREARSILKDAAYTVLGEMIAAIEITPEPEQPGAREALTARIGGVLEQQITALRGRMETTADDVASLLPRQHATTLHREHDRWRDASGWTLINASDPCGT